MDLGATGEKLNNEEKQRLGVGSAVAKRMEVLLMKESPGGFGGRYPEKAGLSNVGNG